MSEDVQGRVKSALVASGGEPEEGPILPGGAAFARIEGWLGSRGRRAAWGNAGPAKAPEAWPQLGGTAERLAIADAAQPRYVFHFLVAVQSDQRAEHMFAVVLDATGKVLDEFPRETHVGTGQTEADVPEALVLAAEAWAVREATALAAPAEAEALGRLHAIALRLVDYYGELAAEALPRRKRGQAMDEALAEADRARSAIDLELRRRLAEEAARHHVRVRVRRIAEAVVALPGTTTTWRLTSPAASRLVELWHDGRDGASPGVACERCGDDKLVGPDLPARGLCRDGHVLCAACLASCQACGEPCCAVDLGACATCAGGVCGGCRATCHGHGAVPHQVCRTHLTACPCCGLAMCTSCRG